jgi:hypothetical protein
MIGRRLDTGGVSFEQITNIGRRRQLGEYAGTHFTMTPFAFDCLRAQSPPPLPPTAGWEGARRLAQPGAVGDLIGIPLVLDPELPADEWRLVDTETGAVLHSGHLQLR